MGLPIFILGSSNTDMVVKAERLPLPGETIIGGDFMMNAGGKGANQAVAAARLGGKVIFSANVGADLFGRQTIELLKKENINTDFVTVDPEAPSGVALINVDAKGENCIVVASGANARLSKEKIQIFLKALQSPSIALLQLEIPMETVEHMIHECFQRRIPVIVNPAPARKLDPEILKKVYAITPNESEAELLTGIRVNDDSSVKMVAGKFHALGIPNVVLTLGERGAYYSSPQGAAFVNAPVVKPMDTTAAGDCFNGALAVALADHQDFGQAVRFACKAASISVTRMGAQASMPTRTEVEGLVM